MENRKIRVAITQGDVNGIGCEVILKTFADPMIFELCTPIVYGSPKVLAYHRKALDLPTTFSTVNTAADAVDGHLNVVNCNDDEVKVELGKPSAESGKAALDALERAVLEYKKDLFDVLVTAPINKSTIQSDSFTFHGHTEYLQERVGEGKEALMILCHDDLRIALVTSHVPLKSVAGILTKELVVEKLKLFNDSLKSDFSIFAPRIAVLSLNPHASDNGLLGEEESTVLVPAIEEARKEGILSFGPFSSDGFFGAGSYQHFDGVLAMYHDQGLVPFKLLAMDEGVNYTAGLPLVRTSPDHGTAYDIAGKNEASENSFRDAIYLALDVWRHRRKEKAILRNPLRKQYFDRRDDSDKLKLDMTEEQ
ncbi:MAG: 4-hydroxythreonine-4-phosphate dehydrogenase PdxA [Bacteroidaceae bacterium]|nr:4-hydroxythreonine-4-phosphate dehydrogenase PdxA [Bacteroidaceae bacterium]